MSSITSSCFGTSVFVIVILPKFADGRCWFCCIREGDGKSCIWNELNDGGGGGGNELKDSRGGGGNEINDSGGGERGGYGDVIKLLNGGGDGGGDSPLVLLLLKLDLSFRSALSCFCKSPSIPG